MDEFKPAGKINPDPLERPVLLRVLCTLSFIGSGWTTFQGLISALSPPVVDDVVLQQMEANLDSLPFPDPEMREMAEEYMINSLLNAGTLGAVNFILGGMALYGVFLMFNLHRKGFKFYVIPQLLMPVFSIWMGGYNTAAWTAGGMSLFLSLLFIGLFSTQLKYMK